jgi:hypothetical protein
MSAAQLLNPKAESRVSHAMFMYAAAYLTNTQRRGEALRVNISAGEGLQQVSYGAYGVENVMLKLVTGARLKFGTPRDTKDVR